MYRAALLLSLSLILAVPVAAAAKVAPLRVLPERDYTLGATHIALVHQKVRFRGLVRDYVPGQVVTVRVMSGSRRYVVVQRTVRRFGAGGHFVVQLGAHVVGPLRAYVSAGPYRARSQAIAVIPRSAAYGDRGLHVQFLQHRLRDLRYIVSLSGVFDGATQQAIMAYRKVAGMARLYSANAQIFERLAKRRGWFVPKYPHHGKHAEADLSRQVLALIDSHGKVFRVLPTSSGKASTPTVRGSFHVYSKTLGVNSLGMVHSVYFVGGYAIHGYPDVPPWAASHGCLRIPIPNARFVNRWLDYGDRVDVYG
jgi:hypothetical protein